MVIQKVECTNPDAQCRWPIYLHSPRKINIEPENDGLEDDFLSHGWFLGFVIVRGVVLGCFC